MKFMECRQCNNKPGMPDLCPSCRNNRKVIEKLQARIIEMENEIKVSDQLLIDRDRLLHSIPACPIHGNQCIPHAVEWVNRIKTFGEIIMSSNAIPTDANNGAAE